MKRTGRDMSGSGTLAVDLFAPGMTALHRVGLAGLAMTLQSLESDGGAARLRSLGSWRVSDRDVILSWSGKGREFFAELLRASFRLTPNGLIWFPALGDPLDHAGHAAVLHNAMLGTFLQHARSRGSSAPTPEVLAVDVDGEPHVIRFLPLGWYAHQRVSFDPARRLEVSGWLYPGGVVRHYQAAAATALSEDPARALALLYAPVGALYFQIRRRTAAIRGPRYAVVLPEIVDLLAYAGFRRLFLRQGIASLNVAGAAEAAVRVLAELATLAVRRWRVR